jgi:hypothetical protein
MFKFFKSVAGFNWNLLIVNLLVYGFMSLAGWISFHDIERLATNWGVYPAIAWTAPIFIDGLMYMGKLGQHHRVPADGRRAGKLLMAFGGIMSLAANVAVGENWGMRAYGALVVVGFVVAEWFSTKLQRVLRDDEAETEEVEEIPVVKRYVVTQAEKDARKRAGYDRMAPGDKARWTATYRRRVASRTSALSPVSPGEVPLAELNVGMATAVR